MSTYKSIAQLKTAGRFLEYRQKLGIELPFDADVQVGVDAPLAQPAMLQGRRIGNRFLVLSRTCLPNLRATAGSVLA
jgi:hypothetical protein